jgi:hypothetical protein
MSRRRAGERRREEIKLGLDVHARQVTICRQVDGDMPQPPVSSYFIRQASDTRKPCRNIRSNKQRSRTSFLLPLAASNQPFNLAAGEVFPVAIPPASVPRLIFPWRPSTRFFPFWRVDHFVESLACGKPRKPL